MTQNLIQQLRATLEKPSPRSLERGNLSEAAHTHTPSILYDLLHKDIWEASDISVLDHIAKRLDISQKLFVLYDQDWRKASDSVVDEPWRSVATLLLYKAFLLEKISGVSADQLYKRLNVLYKSLSIARETWIQEIAEAIQQEGDFPEDLIDLTLLSENHIQPSISKTLPFTVLFYEGPIARAYLETLHSMHIKPEKIIHLISSTDIASKKPIGRFLPQALRKGYADNLQKNKIHYWPKHIAKTHPELRQSILDEVKTALNFSDNTIEQAYTLKPLTHYSDHVTSLLIENLNDKHLHNFLSTYPQTTLLFTGGGIVPASLLSLSHLRFMHVHPGFLPDIKGADCVLWSSLLTGHSSATSFYMSPGIDTGDIILSCWLPKINFNIESQNYIPVEFQGDGYSVKTLYRAVYSFFDPWVRSYVLRKTLMLPHADMMNFSATPQNATQGLTFHFMHDTIQKIALNKLFT